MLLVISARIGVTAENKMEEISRMNISALHCFSVVLPFVLVLLVRTTAIEDPYVEVTPELTSVPREGDAVTLHCKAYGVRPSVHSMSWVTYTTPPKIITWKNRLDIRITDPRYSVINNSTADSSNASDIFHSIVIHPATPNDTGRYMCRVLEMAAPNSYYVSAKSEIGMTVYPASIFPSCVPSGAASVLEGSSVSCAVMADTTTLSVSKLESLSTENWSSVVRPDYPGTKLTASVSPTYDGVTFNCSSVAAGFPEVVLGCLIGPLSVSSLTTDAGFATSVTTGDPTKPPEIPTSTAVIVGVVVAIVFIIIAFLIVALIHRYQKRKLYPSHGSQPTPNNQPSPLEQLEKTANGTVPPPKPLPFELTRKGPPNGSPATYDTQRLNGHSKNQNPQTTTEPVVYAVVNKKRKHVAETKLGPIGNAPGASPVSAQDNTFQTATDTAETKVRDEGIVYAELDFENTNRNAKPPIRKDEPTVYAKLAGTK